VTMITLAYISILGLFIPYFQIFPGNRESLIYLPARGTSTMGIAKPLVSLKKSLSF